MQPNWAYETSFRRITNSTNSKFVYIFQSVYMYSILFVCIYTVQVHAQTWSARLEIFFNYIILFLITLYVITYL